MAFLGRGRGELGLRTPVEHRETKEVTPTTEVGIVVKQSLHVSLALVLLLASVLAAPVMFGPGVFWVVTFIISAASFLWFLRQASTTSYTRNDGEVVGIAPEEIVAAMLFAGLCGFIAWSLQKVLGLLGLSVTWPWRHEWLRGTVRIIVLLAVPATFSYWAHLEVRLSQESFFASGFVEQAFGLLLTQLEPPWYVGRRQRRQADPLPRPIRTIEFVERTASGNIKSATKMTPPLSDDKMQSLARHVLGGAAFSEPGLKGVLSRTDFVKVRDWAIAPARGFVRAVDENKPKVGVMWTEKGKALLRNFAPEYMERSGSTTSRDRNGSGEALAVAAPSPPPYPPHPTSQAREGAAVNERTNERRGENE